MGLPTKKHTKTSRRARRSHHGLKKTKTVACTNCNAKILPHRACPKCGHYKGRKI